MKRTPTQLKNIFTSGRIPTQQDWADLIDSFVAIDSQAAVDGVIVDQKLNAYAQSQQQGNSNGTVDTVGDMYAVFTGVDDRQGLIKNQILDVLNWQGLPFRPSRLNLAWTEQTIVTDTSKLDPQPTQGTSVTNPSAPTWLLSGLGQLTGKYLIIDVQISRRWTSAPMYVDVITAVKVAIVPNAPTVS